MNERAARTRLGAHPIASRSEEAKSEALGAKAPRNPTRLRAVAAGDPRSDRRGPRGFARHRRVERRSFSSAAEHRLPDGALADPDGVWHHDFEDAGTCHEGSIRQLASARQRLELIERERVSVGILELDGPATGRFGNGGQQLHAAGGQGLHGGVDTSFIEAEHDLG